MANLYISEYAAVGLSSYGPMPIAVEPALVEQVIAYTGTSAQSAAFSANTRYIRVHTDSICSVLVGVNPTAVATTCKRLNANQTEYFAVPASYKIAAITNT